MDTDDCVMAWSTRRVTIIALCLAVLFVCLFFWISLDFRFQRLEGRVLGADLGERDPLLASVGSVLADGYRNGAAVGPLVCLHDILE